jgi:hypothetical protein
VRRQGPSIAGGQLLQPLAPITAAGLIIRDALCEQQPFDTVIEPAAVFLKNLPAVPK